MRDFPYSAWVVGDKGFVREIRSAEKLCENDVFTLGLLQLGSSQSVVGLGGADYFGFLCFNDWIWGWGANWLLILLYNILSELARKMYINYFFLFSALISNSHIWYKSTSPNYNI